jgi:hypothetical protein
MRTEEEYLDFEASRLFEVIDIKHMEFCNPQTFGRSSSPSSYGSAVRSARHIKNNEWALRLLYCPLATPMGR